MTEEERQKAKELAQAKAKAEVHRRGEFYNGRNRAAGIQRFEAKNTPKARKKKRAKRRAARKARG